MRRSSEPKSAGSPFTVMSSHSSSNFFHSDSRGSSECETGSTRTSDGELKRLAMPMTERDGTTSSSRPMPTKAGFWMRFAKCSVSK